LCRIGRSTAVDFGTFRDLIWSGGGRGNQQLARMADDLKKLERRDNREFRIAFGVSDRSRLRKALTRHFGVHENAVRFRSMYSSTVRGGWPVSCCKVSVGAA